MRAGESPARFFIMPEQFPYSPYSNGFNPNISPTPALPNTNWNDIWSDWAWYSQENNWLTSSGEVQFSEWSQQMVATMYQNWYNSAPEQMKRAMEAGINPFVAASGIAGSGTGQVASAPPSTPNRGAEALNAIGNLASSLGSGFSAASSGVSLLAKLAPEISKIGAETANIFEQMGFTKLQSNALSISLRYMDQKEQIGVWQALASFDKTKQEYQNLVAGHRNILAQYDEILANIDLIAAQEGETRAREEREKAEKGKIEEETRFIKADNDFFTAHHYRLGTPVYESLRDMMVSDGTFNMEEFGNVVSGYEGKIASAVEHVKAQESWNYRPSNVTEAAAYVGSTIGSSLRDFLLQNQGSVSMPELFTKLRSNASANREFNEAFQNTKEDLYEEYLSKKRYYRNIRRGGNSQEVARAYNAMNTAKTNYEKLTKENFAEELIKSLSPRE